MTDKKSALDDDILDLVMGGTSLYEGADGLNRDSWFVRLVRRRMPNGGLGVTAPPGLETQDDAPTLSTFIVGDYSSRR